jgi:hypothetical protein
MTESYYCFFQYAHRTCVQRWCDEKGDTICEICLQVKFGFSCQLVPMSNDHLKLVIHNKKRQKKNVDNCIYAVMRLIDTFIYVKTAIHTKLHCSFQVVSPWKKLNFLQVPISNASPVM